jgi:hypothetical protein
MNDKPHKPDTEADWAEALDESLAELAAGVPTVPAEQVHRRIRESIERIKANQAAESRQKTATRR